MASPFETAFAATVPAMMAVFADSTAVTYTPSGGSPRSIYAIILRESRAPEYDGGVVNEKNTLTIRIRSDNDTDGVVSPKELTTQGIDTVQIGNIVYVVRRVLTRNLAGMHTLELSDAGTDDGQGN